MRVRARLLILTVVGLAMMVAVVATALVLVNQMAAANQEVTRLRAALDHHQTADEMDDALRADVARAQLAGEAHLAVPKGRIRRQAHRHASRYVAAVRALSTVRLPPRLEGPLERLRSVQETYVLTTERLVTSALSPKGPAPGPQTDFQVAFSTLEPRQHHVTSLLRTSTDRVEHTAAAQRKRAETTIALTAAAALGGWLALAALHQRSLRQLHHALLREAENRAESDLLQRSLMPQTLPQMDGTRLAARSVPGDAKNRVGGDWYDAVRLPSGELMLVVGDVVGHDLPAAVAMGQLRNALRAYALEDTSPARILARVNRAALLLDTSDLATCVVAALDPETMRASWASAGHPPPMITPHGLTASMLPGDPGPPLGVTATAEYTEHQASLADGDSLVLYSDGLVEHRGVPIDIGLARLASISITDTEPNAICDQLLTTMLTNHTHSDDVTCLVLRVELPTAHQPHGPSPTGHHSPTYDTPGSTRPPQTPAAAS